MTVASRWLPTRFDSTTVRPGILAFWNAIAFLALLSIPSQLRLGQPPWTLPAAEQLQAWVWGSAFLVFALFLNVVTRRGGGVGLGSVLVAGAVCYGSAYAVLAFQRDIEYSRSVALLSGSLGFTLAILPFLLGRLQVAGASVLSVATVATLLAGWFGVRAAERRGDSDEPITTQVLTALHPVSIRTFPDVVDSMEMDGGAIESLRDGYVLVTGEGEFYRLEWERGGRDLRSQRLPITAPLDRAAYLSDQQGAPSIARLRVTDFVLNTSSTPVRVYVAHQHWNSRQRCFTMRVSVAPFPDQTPTDEKTPGWETVFDSEPCLPISDAFDDIETGGRLAWYGGGSLLLTVGDHGLSGQHGEIMLAQDSLGSYGKILRLDLAGGHEVFTFGHRNPQGLAIDREGRIWSTEHGPQGGDEVNLIESGNNYGWPLASYGTQYGLEYWPRNPAGRDHGRFVEPVHAFVPAVAISNLIQIGGDQFSRWDGDLLVASLRLMTLFRMRTHDGQVTYVEPIRIGRRIRDLAQGRDGRVVLWTGERDVLVLSLGNPSVGERAYGSCGTCHGPDLGGTALGPSLRHVFDRAIGTRPGFEFSPALKRLGGRWNDERLDAFLRDPEVYAPGTSMKYPGILDAGVRRALIAYLHMNF